MEFNSDYTKYWKKATKKSVDGLPIAGLEEVYTFLPFLNIKRSEKLLDMGCSYGRMFTALTTYTNDIYGVDPDPYAVGKAKRYPYKEVFIGKAEETGFDANYFDKIFCFYVFDAVDHANGFREANRILKIGGHFLVTGKNNNYHPDDEFAFRAEKNAFLKSYPNHFANLKVLVSNLPILGFKAEKVILFPRRGDFGRLKFIEVDPGADEFLGIEYMIICQKIANIQEPVELTEKLDHPFSITAENIAVKQGYISAESLFTAIGID